MMNKQEFISILEKRLSGIPKEDIEKTVDYYNEIILDKMDDGLNEEEAVDSLGDIDEIVKTTLSEISIPKLVKEKMGLNRKLKTWEIILLIATFYIWVPVLLVFFIVVLAIYLCIWSSVIALGACSLVCSLVSLIGIAGIIEITMGNVASGLVLIGVGSISLGIGILLGLLTIQLAKVMILVCKKMILKIKSLLVKRGEIHEN